MHATTSMMFMRPTTRLPAYPTGGEARGRGLPADPPTRPVGMCGGELPAYPPGGEVRSGALSAGPPRGGVRGGGLPAGPPVCRVGLCPVANCPPARLSARWGCVWWGLPAGPPARPAGSCAAGNYLDSPRPKRNFYHNTLEGAFRGSAAGGIQAARTTLYCHSLWVGSRSPA
jgi:hypothetical protein